ncbi:hypothetical protein LCGC14_0455730 [marine sediment metagenome]|uniref:Uncharacterized protein n=1 Tax=marine sediment metagenome TaxID=412755 RepID=A0A0F9SZI8_9ZZZZ
MTTHNFIAFLALTADLPTQYVLRLAHHPSFKLSRCASDILGIMFGEVEAHDDVDAWYAPRECHGVVSRQADKDVRSAISKHGYTPKSFVRELVERTSARWVDRSGLGSRVHEAVEDNHNHNHRAFA